MSKAVALLARKSELTREQFVDLTDSDPTIGGPVAQDANLLDMSKALQFVVDEYPTPSELPHA